MRRLPQNIGFSPRVEEMAWKVSLGVPSDLPYKLQFHHCSIPVDLRKTTASRQHMITSSVFEMGFHFWLARHLADHAVGQYSEHVKILQTAA